MHNLLTGTDAYKHTHWRQYDPKITRVLSYFESRYSKLPNVNYTVFFGLQYYLKKYLIGNPLTLPMIEEAYEISKEMFGYESYFNYEGWCNVLNEYNGTIPLRIDAAREGSIVSCSNVLMNVVNTDHRFPFVTNFFESLLSHVWYPTTIATVSFSIKKLIQEFCEKTGCSILPYHLNDFGCRSVPDMAVAGIGGMAHLLNFIGTDTIPGIKYAKDYYSANIQGLACSVAAAEHSTITSYGRENEFRAYADILSRFPEDAVVSIVADSYNYEAALEFFGNEMRQQILNRSGKFVVRPDSGYPPEVALYTIQKLCQYFGYTTNNKGFIELNPRVGIIYGDGINYESIKTILYKLHSNKIAANNIIFGMGTQLIQNHNRDSLGFAFKCSAVEKEGKWHDVYKQPSGDNGKQSKAGILALHRENVDGKFKYHTESNVLPPYQPYNELETVFYNSALVNQQTFDQIKLNLKDHEEHL